MTKSSTPMTGPGVTRGASSAQLPFASIHEPGTYICNWSGHLLRVPEDGIAHRQSPFLDIVGREPPHVTKIAADPYIPVAKARMLAADLDVSVDF